MLSSVMAKTLKEHRVSVGLTQADLAEKARIHPVTLSKYETGRKKPGYANLHRIAAALGVSAADVIFEAPGESAGSGA
jgi:transcriptional regulator with XRE-family HTH domain